MAVLVVKRAADYVEAGLSLGDHFIIITIIVIGIIIIIIMITFFVTSSDLLKES